MVLDFDRAASERVSEQTRLSIPGCKRGSPGATEHHTAVPWNDAAPQESVEFPNNDATTSQFMLLIVVDAPTFR